MSYELYTDCYILVYYIKDILPDALPEDLDLVINICKENIRTYESSGVLTNLDKVMTQDYSIKKINQAIYLILNIFNDKYPKYNDNIKRLLKLMKIKIIREKKESLRK